jgi:hypothetical protein
MEDPAYREYAAWMTRRGPVPRFIAWIIGARPAAAAAPTNTPAPAE